MAEEFFLRQTNVVRDYMTGKFVQVFEAESLKDVSFFLHIIAYVSINLKKDKKKEGLNF